MFKYTLRKFLTYLTGDALFNELIYFKKVEIGGTVKSSDLSRYIEFKENDFWSQTSRFCRPKKNVKLSGSTLALLSLSACGGGGGAGGGGVAPPTANPAPMPTTSTFQLAATNTYIADSDLPGTFNQPTATADLVVGGRGGNDSIRTGSGDDYINGGAGNDTINSGAGLDTVVGGAGADILNGGAGLDWLSYEGSPSAVNVNLTSGTGAGGHAQGDVISNFELVIGSDYNDTIRGNSQINFLEGAAGSDTIIGVGDSDFITFYTSPSAVNVNLGTGVHTGGHALGDNYTNIYGVFGSIHNDILTGDAQNNELWGNDGNDTLNGGDGNDILDGHNGNDIVNGEGGNDSLIASAGADVMDGGEGVDTLSFFYSNSGVTIDLGAGTLSGGYASGDTFMNIEGVWGSNFADNITGDDDDNALGGLDGIDILSGEGGNDIFYVYEFEGSATEDTFDGGDGYDKFDFESDSLTVTYNVNLADVNLVNVEFIRMGHNYKESLTFTAQDVIDVTDADNILNIMVHAEDAVISSSSWTYVADVMSVGEIYHQYTSGLATVNIYFEAGTMTGFARPAETFNETSTNVFDAIDNNNSSISKEHVNFDLTITGKDGDDLIASGTGNDILNGGAGNDSLRSNFGNDILNGDSGDDILIYDGASNTYNGGADVDTLMLVAREDEIDLSALTVSDLEIINLSQEYSNSISVSAADVLAVTDGANQLIIDGGSADMVSMIGGGWSFDSTGGGYDTFTNGAATLLIDEDIVEVIV